MIRAFLLAAAITNKAVRDGKLEDPRSLLCVDCGKASQVYDHRDYLHPLAVEPVCQRCNLKRGKGENRDALLPSPRLPKLPMKRSVTKTSPRHVRLQALLAEKGITQEAFAREAKIAPGTVSQFLRRKFKSERLAKLLNDKLGTTGAI